MAKLTTMLRRLSVTTNLVCYLFIIFWLKETKTHSYFFVHILRPQHASLPNQICFRIISTNGSRLLFINRNFWGSWPIKALTWEKNFEKLFPLLKIVEDLFSVNQDIVIMYQFSYGKADLEGLYPFAEISCMF